MKVISMNINRVISMNINRVISMNINRVTLQRNKEFIMFIFYFKTV